MFFADPILFHWNILDWIYRPLAFVIFKLENNKHTHIYIQIFWKRKENKARKQTDLIARVLKCKFFRHVLSIGVQSRARSPLFIFRIIWYDRNANVGQIETTIIRHWLCRRGSGVFLNPRRSGGGKLDVKRTRRGWFASRIHALHHYIVRHRSDDRSVTAFFSRDRSLPRDIFP